LRLDELIEHNYIPVIDPTTPDSPAEKGANAFLAEYGGTLKKFAWFVKKRMD